MFPEIQPDLQCDARCQHHAQHQAVCHWAQVAGLLCLPGPTCRQVQRRRRARRHPHDAGAIQGKPPLAATPCWQPHLAQPSPLCLPWLVGLPACRLSSAAFPCPCSCHRKHPACRGQSAARLICIALLQHLADSKLVEKRHEIDIADGLRPLAEELGCSMAQVRAAGGWQWLHGALRWLPWPPFSCRAGDA